MLITEVRIPILYLNYNFMKIKLKYKLNYQNELSTKPNSIHLEEEMDM